MVSCDRCVGDNADADAADTAVVVVLVDVVVVVVIVVVVCGLGSVVLLSCRKVVSEMSMRSVKDQMTVRLSADT